MEYRKKMLTLFTVLVLGYGVYRYYRNSIYIWFCDNEDNQGACTVAGILFEEQHDIVNSTKYYKKSCELKYPQGCYKLGKLLEKNSGTTEAQQYFTKSCDFGFQPACEAKK